LVAKNSNELLETLKLIENCNNCKENLGKHYFNEFHETINKIENLSVKLENERKKQHHVIYNLNDKLIKIDSELNKKVLCEDCKEKKIEKLTDKHGNGEIAKFLYECKLNVNDDEYIQWIPFNELKNIEYLAKGGFGEVHKARWINYYDLVEDKYEDKEVVLKRIYNNSNDDILKEVKV